MALPKDTLEGQISRSRASDGSKAKAANVQVLKKPNGKIPFTEADADEIYRDRLDFFENEVKLSKSEAKKRARESTDNWREEIFGRRRA